MAKVALLGADGKLGPAILSSLLSHGFQVTVLKRSSSKSTDSYPPNVSVARIDDSFSVDAVTPHLQGHKAVVVTIKGSQTDIQYRIAQACVAAGVQRFIPADFGSVDSSSPWTQEVVPLYKRKTELREKLIQLSKENPGFEWTSLVCGHFFDWSLEFMHLWLKERKAEILDDGEVKWSASTLERIGDATARILLNPDATKNRIIYVQSFCVSQNQVVKAFEEATGEKWKIIRHDSKQFEKENKKKADAGDLDAIEELVWLLGALDANWEGKENFAMKTLGLENEDLDQVVRRCVKELS
jgi:nucleoside-diphosphate-sugar epimerase